MQNVFIRLAGTLMLSCAALLSFAQNTSSAGTANYTHGRELVVFEDNLFSEPNGTVPSRWEFVDCVTKASKYMKNLWKMDDHSLLMKTSYIHLKPKMNLAGSLSDSFTVEFDYQLLSPFASALVVVMPDEHKQHCGRTVCCRGHMIRFLRSGDIEAYLNVIDTRVDTIIVNKENVGKYSGSFDTLSWHHGVVDYVRGTLTMYVDNKMILTVPRYADVPNNVLFGGWAPVRYRNVKIATGPYSDPLMVLLKGKSLTTHAIRFDVGKATITPESNSYLTALSDLMKKHAKLKLKIYGHTDADGATSDNMVLSQKRADAVKEFLQRQGVSASRLTTKGFGESKPLDRKNTDEAKALNRRVELIPQ